MLDTTARMGGWLQRRARAGGFVDLSISTRSEGSYTVIQVIGELDVYTVPRLREQLADLIAEGNHDLVVDLQGVDFLDSTALGVLVGGLRRVHPHDGSFQLVCTKDRILNIFRITGLVSIFSIHASVEEATRPGP
jgi:anti-sigma B factor antagonist